ncbi:hypothetical protein BGZ49_006187, partial [Haplosporangium sp. Z 27]
APESQHRCVLVATSDGQIWNIPLSNPISEPTINPHTSTCSSLNHDSYIIPIKIEDSDEEIEEVELWNDEDGLVDSIDVLDSLSPSAKRPRIDSPKAMVSLTSNSGSSFSKVDPTKHLVGHENDVVKIVPALNGLLIFRRHKESILWTSQHGFKPGSLVAKTVVVDTNQADVTCHAVINEGRRLQIFYGLKSGEILLVEQPGIDEKTIKVKKLKTRIQGAILSVIPYTNDNSTLARSLVVVSSTGDIVLIDLEPSNITSEQRVVKMNIGVSISSVFKADTCIYFLTQESRVLRIPCSSIESSSDNDVDQLDLPMLCAMVPVLSSTNKLCGFYGLNHNGQVLWISADLTRAGRPKAALDARDNISEAIRELDILSEQARRLEIECQLENQRIASLNRLVQVLQQSTVSHNHQEVGAITQLSLDHPIKTSFTTFVQPVAAGYNGQRRYYVRLTVESKLNIDWSKGWSVSVNMATSAKTCSHKSYLVTIQHQNIISNLAGLSPHVPWTQDIEIDLQRLCLPLNVTLGLQFDDMSKTSKDRLKEYFDVESLVLDAIHFSEPVRDRAKQNPAYHSQAITALRDDRKTRDESEKSTRRLFFSPNKQENTENDCKECDSVAFKSLIFDIDTTEIKAAQCLPALLGDAIPQDRLNALVNSSIRASLCISTECLPRTGTTRFLENKPILTQCDSGLVWVMLHVKEKSGSIVQASIDIKGVDQARALIVYHGLKKRVHDLFGLQ